MLAFSLVKKRPFRSPSEPDMAYVPREESDKNRRGKNTKIREEERRKRSLTAGERKQPGVPSEFLLSLSSCHHLRKTEFDRLEEGRKNVEFLEFSTS